MLDHCPSSQGACPPTPPNQSHSAQSQLTLPHPTPPHPSHGEWPLEALWLRPECGKGLVTLCCSSNTPTAAISGSNIVRAARGEEGTLRINKSATEILTATRISFYNLSSHSALSVKSAFTELKIFTDLYSVLHPLTTTCPIHSPPLTPPTHHYLPHPLTTTCPTHSPPLAPPTHHFAAAQALCTPLPRCLQWNACLLIASGGHGYLTLSEEMWTSILGTLPLLPHQLPHGYLHCVWGVAGLRHCSCCD